MTRRTQADRSESTRQAILGAARELFADRGYEATPIDEVARRAGVSKGALYHHYRDKAEVLAAVYEELERGLAAQLAASVAGIADPVEMLRTGCQAFLDACLDPVVRRIALVDAPAGLGWERWREIDARHGFGLLRAGLAAAAAVGAVPDDHLDERAHLLLAALMEAALLLGKADDARATREALRAVVDQHIDGLVRN